MSRRPRSLTNTIEDITRALEWVVHALHGQHANAILRNHTIMNDYLRHNPLKFNGMTTLDEANE